MARDHPYRNSGYRAASPSTLRTGGVAKLAVAIAGIQIPDTRPDFLAALDERLAATLCQLARHTPDEPVRLTHQQLAALVGATRERTTTALGELARHELIELRRGKILIRNPARLAAFADDAHSDTTGPA